MSFLAPLFLLGMLALAVPVIIHLTHREKKDVIPFPSLMFLRKIPYRSVRKQKLRHLFLFALRCLALLLIAFAFARPFFESSSASAASALGPREVVLLVDNSYSMGYEDRLSRARAEASGRIQSLGSDDRASIIVFSDRAEVLNQPISDKETLEAAVSGIALSARATSFSPALKLAKRVLDDSESSRKEVVLLSDFQRLGFEGEDDDVWLPAGTTLTPVDLSSAETENLALTSVSLERDEASGRERLTASARITRKAPADAAAISARLSLEIDGRSLQTKPVELAPNTSLTVGFDPVTIPAGEARGSVRLSEDALPQDNVYHFVLSSAQALSVLQVEEGARRSRRGFYVERALAIGDRPSFRIASSTLSELSESNLAGKDVVILNDVPSLSAAASALLGGFVRKGGGLVMVLGESGAKSTFAESAGEGKLLPSPLGGVVDRARDWGGTLSYLDYGSLVFEVFNAPHSGDFSGAKFFRYRGFESPVGEGVLARYDDGAPALVERRLGSGRVLLWTSTLDTFWNDLARQPVFLPFMHQLVKHAASYAEASSWHTVGEVLDVDRYLEMALEGEAKEQTPGRSHDLVITSPSSRKTILSKTEERALLPLEEQGFYEVRRAGAGVSASSSSVAVNLDTAESDLSPLDPEELVAAVTFRETGIAGAAGENAGDTREAQEGRQGYWWFLLAGALLLLATETHLSNRLSMAAR
ncbi:MAG TPA: BatA and WFA domain-containing protein [Vicinamibacteria bacterium]|nr:BatA and WFA domain-containing protein [Vicinamibacteria bacterium]